MVFMFLMTPYGVVSGYVSVTLGYLLSKAGVPVAQIAGLVALSFLPSTFGFGWAHLIDATLSRKGWYLLGCAASAIGLLALGSIPPLATHFPLISIVAVATTFATTFTSGASNGLMAHATLPEVQGRAGGWSQAGSIGGGGLGGGLGLWLATHLSSPWRSGALLALLCLGCASALAFVEEPASIVKTTTYLKTMTNVGRDLWGTVRQRLGLLAMVLCLLPIGSGAAANLWAAVAGDWGATRNMVALVTGMLGGVLSAVGCLLGGRVSDWLDRKAAYVLYGLLQAGCAAGMALGPRTQGMFVFWTCAYAVVTGLTYTGFTAFALEAIGKGAATTKYNAFACLCNGPIYAMTILDGWAYTRWGARGMLNLEAGLGGAGIVAFLAISAWVNRTQMGTERALAMEQE